MWSNVLLCDCGICSPAAHCSLPRNGLASGYSSEAVSPSGQRWLVTREENEVITATMNDVVRYGGFIFN